MTLAIQAEGLVKRFGATTALDGVDLAARTGTVLAVLGPNGAGKTTAVRILATLNRPDAGRASVGGFDVVEDAHRVRQMIALTGQYAAVDKNLTGQENLVLIGRLLGLSRARARRRAAPAWSAIPGSSTSTSPPPAWTRAAAGTCGGWCGGSPAGE
jgi:oleandomycin transport system ATP-binding protein